jgi:rubrerythrin
MDDKTLSLLQHVLRAESRSLVQYVSESFPWITTGEQEALIQFQQLVEEERQATASIAQFLARHRRPLPYFGAYPMSFTTINFVSLEHLLPLLADHEQRALADRERALAGVTDPEARALLQNLVDMKRRHLQTLQALAAAHPETFSTVR